MLRTPVPLPTSRTILSLNRCQFLVIECMYVFVRTESLSISSWIEKCEQESKQQSQSLMYPSGKSFYFYQDFMPSYQTILQVYYFYIQFALQQIDCYFVQCIQLKSNSFFPSSSLQIFQMKTSFRSFHLKNTDQQEIVINSCQCSLLGYATSLPLKENDIFFEITQEETIRRFLQPRTNKNKIAKGKTSISQAKKSISKYASRQITRTSLSYLKSENNPLVSHNKQVTPVQNFSNILTLNKIEQFPSQHSDFKTRLNSDYSNFLSDQKIKTTSTRLPNLDQSHPISNDFSLSPRKPLKQKDQLWLKAQTTVKQGPEQYQRIKNHFRVKSVNLEYIEDQSQQKRYNLGSEGTINVQSMFKKKQIPPKTIQSIFDSQDSDSVKYSIVLRNSPRKFIQKLVQRNQM